MYEAFEDHLAAPRGKNRLTDAPHAGTAGGAPCGDLIRIAVKIEGDTIADAGFTAEGCGAAHAAGSATVELISNKPVLDAALITGQDISNELGGLSPGKIHAATLAADALHTALGAAACDAESGLRLDPHAENRTLIAMSGGVDSTVAALIAQERGHETIAVTLELWADPKGDGTRSCCSPESVTAARALAHSLNIPHFTLDLRDTFKTEVVDDFVSGYASGTTPNPCVRCNGIVRFDAMVDLAKRLNADKLATGHYAAITHDDDGPLIAAAKDPAKDQSYMLARLDPALLDHLWFPLADAESKDEIKERARNASLAAIADKPESQDLCFLAGIQANDLLERQGVTAARGDVVDERGNKLGTHDGHHRYTVGQRRGLSVNAPTPLYVLRKDAQNNRLTVGPKSALAATRVTTSEHRLHRPASQVDSVKLRYHASTIPARAHDENGTLTIELDEPFTGLAPGQTATLLSGDRVVGWGTISDPSDTVTLPLPLATAHNA
jgi:tRNA-specific 2-thiouridylase